MADETRRAPARENVCRSAQFTLVRADDEGSDGLTIEGYGAVFDSITEINSWEGQFEEQISRGAFRKSLRERPLKMQFDHGHHPLLGSLPLGRWTEAKEDERGLHLTGRLADNWLTQPFRDAIRDGGVDGMSFRFAVVREEWVDKDGKRIKEDELLDLLWRGSGDRGPIRRILKEVKASEAGPVVWPAYEDTTVGVRASERNYAGSEVTWIATGNGPGPSRHSVMIDLARLCEPDERRRLAEAVALADAVSALSPDAEALRASLIDRGLDPRQAARIAALDGVGRRSGPAEPPAQDEDTNEPQATASEGAATHADEPEPEPEPPPRRPTQMPEPVPTSSPEGTPRRAAGEHSAPERPVNPYERAAHIRVEYRTRLDRLLTLTRLTETEKERA
jgi:uncharacterized protein